MGAAKTLAARIGMPAEAIEKLTDAQGVEEISALLHGIDTFEEAASKLHEALAPDEDGFRILSVMLAEAAAAEGEYLKRGISEQIYLDTMAAFTRFVTERKRGYGEYGFDRWWWTGRHISLKIFRIGLLEYELCETEGKREISVHIPSDRPLIEEEIDASLKDARAFIKAHFPVYDGAPFVCFSWLLSPALKELLPPTSRIVKFAERFEIKQVFPKDDGYRFFVFWKWEIAPEEFPEHTSLQRAIKRHVLSGGTIGDALGILK